MSFIVDLLATCSPEEGARLFRLQALGWFERQRWYRASHLKQCDVCGKLYIEHHPDPEQPYLTSICNGDLVKL